MLSLRAISSAATSSLPDAMTGRNTASGTIYGTMGVVLDMPSQSIIIDAPLGPVFAIEIYAKPMVS